MGRKKESIAFIDTHIVIWLYDALVNLLSNRAKEAINNNDIYVSPIVKLELEYLYEIKRIKDPPDSIIKTLSESMGLKVSAGDFSKVIDIAVSMNWTRDPFDRIITAEAYIDNRYLITKDKKILKNYSLAIW